jgi:hypothetical protein
VSREFQKLEGTDEKKILWSFAWRLLFALWFPVKAQQPGKVPRIGFLSVATPVGTPYESFRQGLRDLGYVEGQ